MPDLVIRPFQITDRQEVFRIGADTAFFGNPVETYMEDRNAFLDAFYAYYTEFEPGHAWVACADGKVVGFLAGCVDTRLRNRMLLKTIFPRLVSKRLHGCYHIGRRSMKYFWGLLVGLLHMEYTHVDLERFPAHLHINIDSNWRGLKLGKRLMEAYLLQLRDLGIPGVHLDTTTLNGAAIHLYEKMGFRLLDARPNRFWTKWFGQPVENRWYTMRLRD
jgi:ribosomal protein S18 acetylase RimI-like enzyme